MHRKFRNIFLIPIIGMAVGYLMLVIVNALIPESWIKTEVKESAEILTEQGTYPKGYLAGWYLDNFTDADCLSIILNKSSSNPFYNSINAFQLSDYNDPYSASIEALQSTVEGNGKRIGDHSYLWNGYQIWLRPLLIKYNITEIRMLTYILNNALVMIVCIILCKLKNSILAFLPFWASFSFFNFQMESLGLLFFNDICIMLIATIIIASICSKDKQNHVEEVFVGIGTLVAFSSMLIMPLITLGFPLVLYLTLTCNGDSRDGFWVTIKCTVSWIIGYGMTMVTKILLSILFVNSKSGLDRIVSYTGQESFGILDRFERMFEVFWHVIKRSEMERDLVIITSIILIAYLMIKKRKNLKILNERWYILLVALFPCVWCLVVTGHTNHGWTPWNFSISIFAIMQVLWDACEF